MPLLYIEGQIISDRVKFFVGFLFLSFLFLAQSQASDDRSGVRWGVMPVMNYTSDQGMNLGAFARRFDYGSNSEDKAAGGKPFERLLSLQLASAKRGPRLAFVSFEATGLTDMNLRAYSEVYWLSNPYQPYYGIGDNTQIDPALIMAGYYQYRYQHLVVRQAVRKRAYDNLDLEAIVTFAQDLLAPTSGASLFAKDFNNQTRQYFCTEFALKAIFDHRDSEFIPSKGYVASASVVVSPGLLSNTDSWARMDLDFHIYFPLIEQRWLWLAVQTRYASTTDFAPLSERARLGSVGTLRGLPLSRYIDDDSFSLRSELRSILFRARLFDMPLKAGMGFFVDTGKIGNTFVDLITNHWHASWGVSFFGSYFTDDFLGAVDFGFYEGKYSVYVGLGHAF